MFRFKRFSCVPARRLNYGSANFRKFFLFIRRFGAISQVSNPFSLSRLCLFATTTRYTTRYDLKSLAVPLSNTRSLTDTLKNTYACIFHITRSTFPSTFSKFPSYGEIYIALPPNNFPRFNEGRKENVSREDRIVSSRER